MNNAMDELIKSMEDFNEALESLNTLLEEIRKDLNNIVAKHEKLTEDPTTKRVLAHLNDEDQGADAKEAAEGREAMAYESQREDGLTD